METQVDLVAPLIMIIFIYYIPIGLMEKEIYEKFMILLASSQAFMKYPVESGIDETSNQVGCTPVFFQRLANRIIDIQLFACHLAQKENAVFQGGELLLKRFLVIHLHHQN